MLPPLDLGECVRDAPPGRAALARATAAAAASEATRERLAKAVEHVATHSVLSSSYNYD